MTKYNSIINSIILLTVSLFIISCSEKTIEETITVSKVVDALKEIAQSKDRIKTIECFNNSIIINYNESEEIAFDKDSTPVFSFDPYGHYTVNGNIISLSKDCIYNYNEKVPNIIRGKKSWSIDSYETNVNAVQLIPNNISVSYIFEGKRKVYFCISDGSVIEILKEPIVPQKEYFVSETEKVTDKIKKLSDGNECLLLVQFTDIHERTGHASYVNRLNQTITNITELANNCSIDGVLCLGDALWPDDKETYYSQDIVNLYLDSVISRIFSIHDKSYFMLGNHEGLYGSVPKDMVNYESQFAKMDPYIVRDNGKPWYYFDNERTKVRCIVLAAPDPDNISNVWEYSTSQLKWLAETALKTNDDWSILIFSHTHPYNISKNSPLKNHATLAGILNAYNSHAAYSDKLISVDYSQYKSVSIAAMFVGHAHEDNIITRGNEYFNQYDLDFPTIVTDKSMTYGGDQKQNATGGITQARKTNSVSQDLWDTIVYCPSKKNITLIRFGAGNDRTIDL